MAPFSRFEHVEAAPSEDEPASPSARPSLARFGEEREHHAPHQHQQLDPMRPAPGSESLRRFDADGADGVGLVQGQQRDLPLQRCHRCLAELGKFEGACHRCGAAMDTDEARRFNAAQWEAQRPAREAEARAQVERLHQRVREGSREEGVRRSAARDMARELEAAYGGSQVSAGALAGWLLAAGALVLGLASHRLLVQLACAAVVVGFLLMRLPRVGRALVKPRRRPR